MANTKRVFEVTSKNVRRNKWLTFSTILVSVIVFTLSSIFISMALLTKEAVEYYEQKAQVIVFFKKDTQESDILAFRDKMYNPELVEHIEYVSQSDALEIYKEDFADNPDLISTVTADSLPASVEVRAKDIDALLTVISAINTEKETNANIDEVLYFRDVVENIRTLSRIINVGSIILIAGMAAITIALIRVTIGFNIKLHQEEIQIMHLVGSSDKFIKLPFLLEGAFYGLFSGLVSPLMLSISWYILIYYTTGTDFSFWISQMLTDFNLGFLLVPTVTFLLIYFGIHIVTGTLLGYLSSYSTVRKYLNED